MHMGSGLIFGVSKGTDMEQHHTYHIFKTMHEDLGILTVDVFCYFLRNYLDSPK